MLISNEQDNLPFYSEKHHDFQKIFCLKFPNKDLLNPIATNIHIKNSDNNKTDEISKIKVNYESENVDLNKNFNRLHEIVNNDLNNENNRENKENKLMNYDLGFILKENIISKINKINLNLNSSVIKYFFKLEKLQLHFDFTFKIFLFENCFGLNIFASELFKSTDNYIVDNQYLKYRLEDIFQNQEFTSYTEFFKFSQLTLSPQSELIKQGFRYEVNKIFSDKSYLYFNYKPNWPISIFFYEEVLDKFNKIFNFIFRVKKYSSEINNVEYIIF